MSEITKQILFKVRYATVSTVDENNKAWAAPVWYVYDEENTIYWWSPVDAQHSKNIERDNGAYITIFDSSAPEGEGIGLYIRTEASLVPDEKIDKVIARYNESTKIFKVNRENTSGDAPTRLYQATPVTIQINDGIESNGFYQDFRRDDRD